MEDLKFYANNFKDIFVEYFNEINVENKFTIMDVEEDRNEKCFNLFEIIAKNGNIMFLNVDWSIEEEYKVEGANEKEYGIKMLIRLTRENINLKKTYYFKTYSIRYDWGRTLFQLVSQVTAEMIRNLLGWDIEKKEEEI